jgi:hypothetical protein
MKKLIVIFSACILLLSACTGVKTLSSGLENEAYLKFVGDKNLYEFGVEVTVDDKTTFTAQVVNDNIKAPTGNVYAIAPGTHIIKVKYNNSIIYTKKVFVSTQETKKIILP